MSNIYTFKGCTCRSNSPKFSTYYLLSTVCEFSPWWLWFITIFGDVPAVASEQRSPNILKNWTVHYVYFLHGVKKGEPASYGHFCISTYSLFFTYTKHIGRTSPAIPYILWDQQSSQQGQEWWSAVFRAISRWGQGGTGVTRTWIPMDVNPLDSMIRWSGFCGTCLHKKSWWTYIFSGFMGGKWKDLAGIHENRVVQGILMGLQQCGEICSYR